MNEKILKLLAIGGSALTSSPSTSTLARPLTSILGLKNGFYAFEGALHVIPDAVLGGTPRGLADWNAENTWVGSYDHLADGALFFAEDALGSQFALRDGEVVVFDPETGTFEPMARDLEDWAAKVLADPDVWTAHSLARAWQEANGQLRDGHRLVPVTPFVLGGAFSVENLRSMEATKGMRYRAEIAVQIRDLPDGTPVNLRVVD